MRAVTTVFVLLIALPAAALGWLGFQYAGSLEEESRRRIRRETREEFEQAHLRANEMAAAIVQLLDEKARKHARLLAEELPFREELLEPQSDRLLHVGGSLQLRLHAQRADGTPLGRTELTELPEWDLYAKSRDSAMSAEWVVGDHAGAQRVLERAARELVSPRLRERVRNQLAKIGERLAGGGEPPGAEFVPAASAPLPRGGRVVLSVRYAGPDSVIGSDRMEGRVEWTLVNEGGRGAREESFGRIRDVVPVLPGAGVHLSVELRHRGASRLAADSSKRQALTLGGIGALVLLMVVGLLLVRRALMRERDARRLRDAFIANVSHELKTPLTSVRMYAEMLADGQLDAGQREQYGRVVDAEGARLAALVDDMLDFSALERGARVLDIEPIDVAGLARGTIDAWGPLAEREGVELELEIAAHGATALADATALSRILSNLLQNALKYGQPARDGGTPRIRVEVNAMLTVCDNGPGVSADDRAVIFDRFRRGADAGNKAGAGIGLALSRELARAMNGDLMVEDDGTWTRFTLRLPPLPDEPA